MISTRGRWDELATEHPIPLLLLLAPAAIDTPASAIFSASGIFDCRLVSNAKSSFISEESSPCKINGHVTYAITLKLSFTLQQILNIEYRYF